MAKDANHYKKPIQYILIAISLYFIVNHFTQHSTELNQLRNFTTSQILILTSLMLVILLAYGLKSLITIKQLDLKNIKVVDWLRIFVVSRLINYHITQGANIYRALVLKRSYGFSYTRMISMATIFAWFETLSVLSFSSLLIFLYNKNLTIANYNVLAVLLISIILLLIIPFVLMTMFKSTQSNTKNNLSKRLSELASNFVSLGKNGKLIINFLAISYLTFILYMIIVKICFTALGIQVELSELILFSSILLLSRVVQIVPGNLGISEIICGAFAQQLGATLGSGIIISGITRIGEYLVTLLVSLFFIKDVLEAKQLKS